MEIKKMYRWIMVFLVMTFLISTAMANKSSQDYPLFETIFSTWTDAFNHKDLVASCKLFSPKMVAHYQGLPPKNYSSVCNGFKKIFKEPLSYKYNFKLHQVYRSNDLAAVRITWYLRISKENKLISATKDEGLDVFQRDAQGDWKIVNYLGYPEK